MSSLQLNVRNAASKASSLGALGNIETAGIPSSNDRLMSPGAASDVSSISGEANLEAIQVVLRVRPARKETDKARAMKGLGSADPSQTIPCCIEPLSGTLASVEAVDPETKKSLKFHYDDLHMDRGFNGSAESHSAFYESGIRPLVKKSLDNNFSLSVFCYGQTGSGKTYSMQGESWQDENRGMLPRVAEQVFDHLAKEKTEDPEVQFEIKATYVEIYNEKIRDLLLPSDQQQPELKIRQDPDALLKDTKNMMVRGCTERVVRSVEDWCKVVEVGLSNRTVAATAMNETSSRSHAIFTIIISETRKFGKNKIEPSEDGNASGSSRYKIHMVDLAGSERADSTGATGKELKAGAFINQSLSSLGNVINALSQKRSHVPYRDSQLTWLLSDSLGGSGLTCFALHVSPESRNYSESVSTLRFGTRAKKVQSVVQRQACPKTVLIQNLQREVASLRAQLTMCVCQGYRDPVKVSENAETETTGVETGENGVQTNRQSFIVRVAHKIVGCTQDVTIVTKTRINQTDQQRYHGHGKIQPVGPGPDNKYPNRAIGIVKSAEL